MKLNGKALLIAALLCSVIGFASCSSAPSNNTAVVVNNSKPANTAPANTAKTETATTGDKTGVPECDEYIEKYEAKILGLETQAALSDLIGFARGLAGIAERTGRTEPTVIT